MCIAVAMAALDKLEVPIRVAFDGIRFECDANGAPVPTCTARMSSSRIRPTSFCVDWGSALGTLDVLNGPGKTTASSTPSQDEAGI